MVDYRLGDLDVIFNLFSPSSIQLKISTVNQNTGYKKQECWLLKTYLEKLSASSHLATYYPINLRHAEGIASKSLSISHQIHQLPQETGSNPGRPEMQKQRQFLFLSHQRTAHILLTLIPPMPLNGITSDTNGCR